MEWDVFVSYASEDKSFARSLAKSLKSKGVTVWYDEFILEIGDSLRSSIDHGLANSRFGIVVLSEAFFSNNWPQFELSALWSRESLGEKVIIPIWHKIDVDAIKKASPFMADKYAISSEKGLEYVVSYILRTLLVSKSIGKAIWTPYEVSLIEDIQAVILPLFPAKGRATWISKYPLTNRQYMSYIKCQDEVQRSLPKKYSGFAAQSYDVVGEDFQNGEWVGPFLPLKDVNFNDPDKPVVCISYDDALSYIIWYDDQLRLDRAKYTGIPHITLPTDLLWDFAACGTDTYTQDSSFWVTQTPDLHHKSKVPATIDYTGRRSNIRGVSDMFGNVWEWTRTGHRFIPPGISHWSTSLKTQDASVRGGSYLDDLSRIKPYLKAIELPHGKSTRHSDLGFRISGTIDSDTLPPEVQLRLSVCQNFDWEPIISKWPL